MMYEKWLEWDEWIYKQHKIYDQEQQQQDLIEGLHLIDICLKKEHHTNVFILWLLIFHQKFSH